MYEKGDYLAKLSVEEKMSPRQLEDLLHKTKRIIAEGKECSYLLNHIKYQMSRDWSWKFGEELIKAIEEVKCDLNVFLEIIRQMIMLHRYYNAKNFMESKDEIEKIIREQFGRKYGITDITVSADKKIKVRVPRFIEGPKFLKDRIEKALREQIPNLRDEEFNVWIDYR